MHRMYFMRTYRLDTISKRYYRVKYPYDFSTYIIPDTSYKFELLQRSCSFTSHLFHVGDIRFKRLLHLQAKNAVDLVGGMCTGNFSRSDATSSRFGDPQNLFQITTISPRSALMLKALVPLLIFFFSATIKPTVIIESSRRSDLVEDLGLCYLCMRNGRVER